MGPETMTYLVSQGLSPDTTPDKSGNTARMIAESWGTKENLETIDKLMEDKRSTPGAS